MQNFEEFLNEEKERFCKNECKYRNEKLKVDLADSDIKCVNCGEDITADSHILIDLCKYYCPLDDFVWKI